MEATRSSETLVPYRNTTRRHNLGDLNLNLHFRENIKSRVIISDRLPNNTSPFNGYSHD